MAADALAPSRSTKGRNRVLAGVAALSVSVAALALGSSPATAGDVRVDDT